MREAEAVRLIVVIAAGGEVPELFLRQYFTHRVDGRAQAQRHIRREAEAPAVAHLDAATAGIQHHLAIHHGIHRLADAVAVEHAVEHLLGDAVEADRLELLVDEFRRLFVGQLFAAGANLPRLRHHRADALLETGFHLLVAQHLLVDGQVAVTLERQQLVGGG